MLTHRTWFSLACGVLLCASVGQAGVAGFNGAWDPTNVSTTFSLTNFFPWGCQFANPTLPVNCDGNLNYTLNSMVVSGDHSTLTVTILADPNGTGSNSGFPNNPGVFTWDSVGFGSNNPAALPAGLVTYDYSVTFSQDVLNAETAFPTANNALMPCGDNRNCGLDGGTYNGSVSCLQDDNSNCLSFGTGFNLTGGTTTETIVFSNFEAPAAPEPTTLLLAGTALLGLVRRRLQRG